MECGDAALHATGFFRVEILIRRGEKLLNSFSIPSVNRNADARGELRHFLVLRHHHANAIGDALRFGVFRFWQHESKLIAAVACGGINGAAMNAQDGGKAAERAAANEMTEAVVDFFQTIQIEKQDGEGPAGAVGALGFVLEDVEEPAIVGEAGERIADGEMADLFEQARVIQERAAKSKGIAAHSEDLREHKRRVEKPLGLGCGDLSGEVHPSRSVDGAIERSVLGIKATPIPNYRREKNYAGQELLRTGYERGRMPGSFRWKAAKRGGDHIRETDDRQQSAGYFRFRMARTGNEMLDEQRDKKHKGQKHAAEPPSHRRPIRSQRENLAGIERRERRRPTRPRLRVDIRRRELGRCGPACPENERELARQKRKPATPK